MGYAGGAFIPHYDKKLPHVIGPGEVWSCCVKQENIDGLHKAGIPKLEIHATCRRRARLVLFPVEK
jgi:hypothetical protein